MKTIIESSPDKDLLVQAVYEIVRRIPYGRVTSYGAIAKATGHPGLSRMIGRIMSECNSSETRLPAHRVVNSQGKLSGKHAFGHSGEMQKLLEEESITISGDRIIAFKSVFWDPLTEIR